MTSHFEPAPRRRWRPQPEPPIGVLASWSRMILALFLCAGFFILVSPTAQATGGSGVDCVPTSMRECTPQPDREETTTRTEGTPDCEAKTVTVTTVTTITEYTFDDELWEWVANVTEETTTSTRPVTAAECPTPPVVTPPVVTPPVVIPPVVTPPEVETPEEETPEEETPEEETPEEETPEEETPEEETPPVVVPGDNGGVVPPPATGGHQPGTSNPNPGTVVISTPEGAAVPRTVAAGLGGDVATASTSAATARSMSLLGGGLVFLVTGLLLSRRKVR